MKFTKPVKKAVKNLAKKTLRATKKLVKSNKYTHRAVRLLKRAIFPGWSQAYIHYHLHKYYPSIAEYYQQQKTYSNFKLKPLISIVMPTYNTPAKYLQECIESVLMQSYPYWELCIADDASSNPEVVDMLKQFEKSDDRVKIIFRKENGHISAATNSAIGLANGEFIALLDHDDLLWPNALYEVVKVINNDPNIDLIYSDEDKVDQDSDTHSYPFLKPDWSPEFLESCNFITHFACIRATLIKTVGGLREGYEGAQDWDLFIRIAEKTNRIEHIPKILYSWRVHDNSTAQDTDSKPYVYEAQRKLLEDHLQRTTMPGKVALGIITQHSVIQYDLVGNPKVAIFVVGHDESTKNCVRSIKSKTTYNNFTINIVPRLSALNEAIDKNDADYIVIIRAEAQIETSNWLELLLGDAQRPGVGAVGPKLVDRSRRFIRSAGYGIGLYGAYAHLLDDMDADETHYLRGLYGQSRRNVSALSGSCLMVNKATFHETNGIPQGSEGFEDVALCLQLIELGYRNIYNPHVQIIETSKRVAPGKLLTPDKRKQFRQNWKKYIDNDPYLNPNFRRDSSGLEIS